MKLQPTEDLQTIINQQKQLLEEKTKDVAKLTTKLLSQEELFGQVKRESDTLRDEIKDLKDRIAHLDKSLVDKNVIIA